MPLVASSPPRQPPPPPPPPLPPHPPPTTTTRSTTTRTTGSTSSSATVKPGIAGVPDSTATMLPPARNAPPSALAHDAASQSHSTANVPQRSPTAIVSTSSTSRASSRASSRPSRLSRPGVLDRFRGALARHTKSASTSSAAPTPAANASMSSLPLASHRRHERRPPDHSLETNSAAAVFGVPLPDSVRVASALVPDGNGTIPFVVLCIGTFLKAHAVHVEGVFRKVGSQRRMRELQAEFERAPSYGRQLDFGLDSPDGEPYYTVHDAACVLRRYLTSLPDPLVPRDLWMGFRQAVVQSNPEYYGFSSASEVPARRSVDNWIAASTASGGNTLAPTRSRGSPVPSSTPPQALATPDAPSNSTLPPEILTFRQLLDRCPQVNRELILYLLDLLAVFAAHHETNFMTAANLAVIFQPSFFNHPSLLIHPEEHKLAVHALELLIVYHGALRPATHDAQHTQPGIPSNDAHATTPATLSTPASFPPTSWQGASHSTAYLAASASLGRLYRSPYPPSSSHHSESVARTSTTTPTTITTTSTDEWDRRRSEQTTSTYASASIASAPSAPSASTGPSAPCAPSAQASLPSTTSTSSPRGTSGGVTSSSNAKLSSPLGPKGTQGQAKPPQALPFLPTNAPPRTMRAGPKARIISVDSLQSTPPSASAPTLPQPTPTPQPSTLVLAPHQTKPPSQAQHAPPVRLEGSTPRLPAPASRLGSPTSRPESRSTFASLSMATEASTPGTPTTPPEPETRPTRSLSRRKRSVLVPSDPVEVKKRRESWTNRLGRHLFGKKHDSHPPQDPKDPKESKEPKEPKGKLPKGPPPKHEPKHVVQMGIPFPPPPPPRGSSLSPQLPTQRSRAPSSSARDPSVVESEVTREDGPSASSVAYVGRPTRSMAVPPGTNPVALAQDTIPAVAAVPTAPSTLPSVTPSTPPPPQPAAGASVPAPLPTPKEELQDPSVPPNKQEEASTSSGAIGRRGSGPSRSGSNRSGRSIPSRSTSCRSNGGVSRSASHRSTHSGRRPNLP